MLFHKLEIRPGLGPDPGAAQLEASKGTAKKRAVPTVKIPALIWAGVLTAFFAIAAIVSHAQAFAAGETAFLNLTVALLSASTGAFLGERLTVSELNES